MTDFIPKTPGGWGAIGFSLKMANRAGGLFPMLKALMSKNSCKSCALGMGGQKGGMTDEKRVFPAVCNKSFMAQASDMQGGLPKDFFSSHSIKQLETWDPRQLELSGRLTEPVIHEGDTNHYRSISWEEAFDRVASELKACQADRAFFYSSGRSSNEAAFLLQILARVFGSNNVNNCSYFCHQASGVGLTQTLGTSTATVQLEDLDKTDLIFLIGANPASNHPRFMKTLMQIRRRGGKVIVVNPVREPGLLKFSVPSDPLSLLFGSDIATDYLQPHIGGDLALFKGIAKAVLELSSVSASAIEKSFINDHTENFDDFKNDLERSSWEELESASGLSREQMKSTAQHYVHSKNVVFAWAMGVTHHLHGVNTIHSIVNLALMRQMTGRPHAGLLPLRGHSNVQGVGSMGFVPQLKSAFMENLKLNYGFSPPAQTGMDTLACIEAAAQGGIDFAWNLGGNLYGSAPDSQFASAALSKINFSLYMNTTLNQGHFLGRGKTTLILPVRARDEEPSPTTQESMFSFVRLSDGGLNRHPQAKSEIEIISAIGQKTDLPGPVSWEGLGNVQNIRSMIGKVVPGFEKMLEIDQSKIEFHIRGRSLYTPQFPTQSGKARFQICNLPDVKKKNATVEFNLMTVRSEGQFNTVVYELHDNYRGINSRDVVMINPEDINTLRLKEGDRVTVTSAMGRLENQRIVSFPIKPGNLMMYYPEANVLTSREIDPLSRTPSFKSVRVSLTKA